MEAGLEGIYPELTLDDIRAIAPITRKGDPDLYNHMPTRIIPLPEARYRKWSYYFPAAPCRYGHVAPRYTSNSRICVDCKRVKKGKSPIGEKSRIDNKNFPGRGGTLGKGITVKVEKPLEVDAWERKFLEAFAYHKDHRAACAAINITEAQIDARLAHSAPFKYAYEALEARMLTKKLQSPEKYVWTEENRTKFIEVYINTGEIATARDSIAVTPFEYFQEIKRNPDFAEQVKEAEPLANMALEERAYQLALAGNDKLLSKILSVKKPEYKENIKVDMNVTEKLDDKQLSSRLLRLLNKLRPPVIEVECTPIAESGATPAITASRGTGSEEIETEDRSILPYSRSKSPIS